MLSFFSRELQLIKNCIFNLRFLYELKQKVRLSKTVCGIFHFRFRFVFIKVYFLLFLLNKMHGLFDVIIPFKIKMIERLHTVLLPDVRFLSCNKKF